MGFDFNFVVEGIVDRRPCSDAARPARAGKQGRRLLRKPRIVVGDAFMSPAMPIIRTSHCEGGGMIDVD